ncbi:hypothetical protein [Spirillospora sp. CA-294931]|uniref:hypothetical protein n=1 Tax=Spirillospora sp. CA-294931 TaxID=3240042 RepID=UPI003D8A241F
MNSKKLRKLGRRLVEAKATSDAAAQRYRAAREETTEALVQAHRKHGVIKTAVEIPGLGQVATITLKQGSVQVTVHEDELLEATTEHAPTEIEHVIAQEALTDPKVIEAICKVRPDAVTPQVRQAWRTAKIEEAKKTRGWIALPTGEQAKIATVVHHPPTGDFQLTWTGEGKTFANAFAGDSGEV